MADLQKITEMEKSGSSKLVFSVTEYQGEMYVDVREYVTTATYTGFTKKGFRLHSSKLEGLIERLKEVQAVLAGPGAKTKSAGGEAEEGPD